MQSKNRWPQDVILGCIVEQDDDDDVAVEELGSCLRTNYSRSALHTYRTMHCSEVHCATFSASNMEN